MSAAARELASGGGGSRKRRAEPVGALWNSPGGKRMLQRYVGHCNVQTDIKEAVFVGLDDSLVACGSDDGMLFIYKAVRCCIPVPWVSSFL